MSSAVEFTGSVRPTKLSGPSVALPTRPFQVGLKLFQSEQPAVSGARLPSASSKPVWSASDPSLAPPIPQPVDARSGERAEPAPVAERLAEDPEERETDEACPWARESRWVELLALPPAEASPDLCCARMLPEAAPSVSSDTTTKATRTVAPIRLRRPLHDRRWLLGLLIPVPLLP